MLRKALLVCACLSFAVSATAQEMRHFKFHYGFTVTNIPAGEKVRVWFPMAHSDSFQDVKVVSASGDLALKKTHESRFGNDIYYAEAAKAKASELHFEVVYDVVRHERLTLGMDIPHLAEVQLSSRERKEYLAPDKLVPITGVPAEEAATVTAGKTVPLQKARAIYDYVFDNMKYDKTGTGWGRGDVLFIACNAKKGNCTDFHSLFYFDGEVAGNIPATLRDRVPPARRQIQRRDCRIPLLGGIL